jgi:hypothetical protein
MYFYLILCIYLLINFYQQIFLPINFLLFFYSLIIIYYLGNSLNSVLDGESGREKVVLSLFLVSLFSFIFSLSLDGESLSFQESDGIILSG